MNGPLPDPVPAFFPARPELRRQGRDARLGSVLVLGLIVSVLLTLTMAAAISTTRNLGRQARGQLDRTRAFALAEGVTESARKRLLEQHARFEPLALSGTVSIDGTDYPYTASPIGESVHHVASDGVRHTTRRYRISAAVEVNYGYARIDHFVDLISMPLFQYAIFFADDLELLPRTKMTLRGRVHANGDLFVGSGDRLTLDTVYFRSTGRILRQKKHDGSAAGGAVRIRVNGTEAFSDLLPAQDARHRGWTNHALDTWKTTVQDGSHGVTGIAAPTITALKAFLSDGTKGHFHRHAGLVIVDAIAYKPNGEVHPLPVGTIRELSFYDAREGQPITVTDIDLALLHHVGAFPTNGLLYAYRTDVSPRQPNGIRLTNGAELARPLTVVSEDPVYIRGDYNTVNKKGAAVIADAVNLLSNAWDDTRTSVSVPPAAPTEYNLALVAGNVRTPDGGGSYSGGFGNLPRFHEDWTDVTARIRGSFVNLFESEIARSPWSPRNVYAPPLRDWSYDDAFNDPKNLPPFAPLGAHFRHVFWDDGVPLPFALRETPDE